MNGSSLFDSLFTTMGELSRKERERLEHRRAVLDAAEEVFAQKGFHNATVQEIAAGAEFAVGTLYNMFEGKTAIYRELILMRARDYAQRVSQRLAQLDDPVQKVRALVKLKLEFFQDHQQFFRIFRSATSGEEAAPPCGLSEDARRLYDDYVAMMREVFAEGRRRGVFVELDPMLLALAVEGITNALIAHGFHTRQDIPIRVRAQAVEDVIFNGILRRGNRQ